MNVQEMRVAASATEGYVDPKRFNKKADRLRELFEERKNWIAKREELVERKEKLFKLLQLQDPRYLNIDQIQLQKTLTKAKSSIEKPDEVKKVNAVNTARKVELKGLQARAEAAQVKQQAAAKILAHRLKQLLTKRKRDNKDSNEPHKKKTQVSRNNEVKTVAIAPEMHSFAPALGLDVGTSELVKAACFRITTRHLVQTGRKMSRQTLEQTFKTYTGKGLEEVINGSLLEQFLATLVVGHTKNSPSSPRKVSVCWQPGRQFLKTPTFISSNSGRIQTMIELEKDVVASTCDSLDGLDRRMSAVMRRRRQHIFFAHVPDDRVTTQSTTMLLSAFIGVDLTKTLTCNFSSVYNRSTHLQMADVLERAETWLCEQAEASEPHSSRFDGQSGSQKPCGGLVPSRYAKPFSITNDSVVRQLNGGAQQPSLSRTIDPMKVMCRYELNGVCKDKNCSDYHQKDYEPGKGAQNNESDGVEEENDDTGITVGTMNEMDQLLVSFAAFRARITVKWPVISTTRALSSTAKPKKDGMSLASNLPLYIETDAAAPPAQDPEGESDSGDFIALDSQEELPSVSDARYFDDIDSRKLYGEKLQAKVDKTPTATDAWLLLAIYQLELVVGLSDDAVKLSDNYHFQQQLLLLSRELISKPCNSAHRIWAVEEANLKRCLHTLSRALEVEENAYCEALWLLYLDLCKHVTSQENEIDMVEQGVQFLPTSHALWLRYISTYDFKSVSVAEDIHWRLLQLVARTNSAVIRSEGTKIPTKDVSILLTAISLHLCTTLWYAGATSRVLELLSALLQLGSDQPSEFAWCTVVHGQLRHNEVIVLYMIFAHILLFHEIPELIEHWVAASNSECIPIEKLAYKAKSLRDCGCDFEAPVLSRAIKCYKLAFQAFEKDCDALRDAGNVILSNWMLLLAVQRDDKKIEAFFSKNVATIQQFPSASLTAAKLVTFKSTGGQEAHQLMLRMMNQSSKAYFPESLHYYLFACRQSKTALLDALDTIFPDIMERLANLVNVDIKQVKSSIRDIMHNTSTMGKSRALKDLLEVMLGAWINQLALIRQEKAQHKLDDKQKRSHADIYVALDICHLMGVLLKTSVAVDGIQMVLSSPSFGSLPYEARQLAWVQRFVFQVNLLQEQESKHLSWRQHQATLITLFRKYMLEMSVEAEMMRHVSRRIKSSIAKNSFEDAVRECLNPERRQLFTYGENLEIFRLCSAAIAGPDKAAFFASCTDLFASSPEFSRAFADIATHEWELLAARTSLRKCLSGTKTQHSKVLQAVVAVELRLKNMKNISSLLDSEIQVNPLHVEPWRLIVALEILVGEKAGERSQVIADEIEKRQLVFTCNTFGDDQIVDQNSILWGKDIEDASLSLRGLGLQYVPTAVLLRNELISLDISGNQLLELPLGLRNLTNLQQLNASENALLEFPACVKSLIKLQDLRLAHNNITTFTIPVLPQLHMLDIRWNPATQLPASDVVALSKLKILEAEENFISTDELLMNSELLSSREDVVSLDGVSKTEVKHPDDSATEQPNLTESLSGEATQPTEARCPNNETTTVIDGVCTAYTINDDDRNQTMEVECAHTASTLKEDDSRTMASTETIHKPEIYEDVVTGGEECVVPSVFKELHDDQNLTQDKAELACSLFVNALTPVNNAAERAKNVQCLKLTDESDHETNVDERRENDSEDKKGSTRAIEATIILPRSAWENLRPADIAEMKNFAQNYSKVATSTAIRRQSSQDEALLARKRLATYMDQNHIDNRAEVRHRNPTLWRAFMAANLPMNLELPACRLCSARNNGYNQRFNSTVLCVSCLEEAVLILKERKEHLEGAEEIV